MNYPVWEIPSAGLLIAGIAILHVFISHFAVGGGLFLVLTEHRARRERDDALLGFVRKLSRFFILLTLVLGAVTGVGIWFTIGLVHPQATSSLISTFVWGWAIEWTFFVAEIAAAMVYYYGWDRLSPKAHLAVGWVYFANAWLSLAVINGILSYMLTPGSWVTGRGFFEGILNPTYFPSLVARTFAACGLAGIYALAVAAWSTEGDLRRAVGRWAAVGWVIPMAVGLPLSLVWYLAAASRAGVPVGAILGAPSDRVVALARAAVMGGADSGYAMAQRAAFAVVAASCLALLLALGVLALRRGTFGKLSGVSLMALALVSIGGGEWFREDLRKPWVIGQYMFVNGVRLPSPDAAPRPPAELASAMADPYEIEALNRYGVIAASRWVRIPEGYVPGKGPSPDRPPAARADVQSEAGAEVFRLLCSTCHTRDGYLAIRPLVRGKSASALDGILQRLAEPRDESGKPTKWSDPHLRVATWRERRMPPFVGTEDERRALAVYLARLGGTADAALEPTPAAAGGAPLFDSRCSMCHGAGSDFPMEKYLKGRSASEFYDLLGKLDSLSEMMPSFDGTDEERRALADHLARLAQETGGAAR